VVENQVLDMTSIDGEIGVVVEDLLNFTLVNFPIHLSSGSLKGE
jgi:hypothetical protein